MYLLAHKIEIRPNASQTDFLRQSIGCRRFVWNNCLAEWNDAYRLGLKPDFEYIRFFLKCLKEKHIWLNDVSAHVLDNTIRDLHGAWQRFFKGTAKPPRFKKKGMSDSFRYIERSRFAVEEKLLRIERLKTLISMRETVRFEGQHRQCTISSRGGKFFASILVKVPGNPFTNKFPPNESQVGVDLGVKELATLSDGAIFPASQPFRKSMDKLAKLQIRFARTQRGSNRRAKLNEQMKKLHYRVACQRSATLHGLTDYLTRNYQRITIEDLNVSGMVKNHKLARAVSDCGFYEFRRQLGYKASLRGCEVVIADRWFPSSKLCSRCGALREMPLSKREYICACGLCIDRDLNASINLLNYKEQTDKGCSEIPTMESANCDTR